jgi:quercetin dioxygenase-like cupin family protein
MLRWSSPSFPRAADGNTTSGGPVGQARLAPGTAWAFRSDGLGEAALVVLQGAVELEETDLLTARDAIYCPPGSVARLSNLAPVAAVLLVIQEPIEVDRGSRAANGWPSDRRPRVIRNGAVAPVRLGTELGFASVESSLAITSETVGSVGLLVGLARFAPGGAHRLHRHRRAAEIMYVFNGERCCHLDGSGESQLSAGDLTYVTRNEWHGLRNDGERPAEVLFAYVGAASVNADGYELAAV